jgi:hypothetical protein
MEFQKGGRRKEEKLNERKEKLVVTYSLSVKFNRLFNTGHCITVT